jgi:Rod binding domain-containing protein
VAKNALEPAIRDSVSLGEANLMQAAQELEGDMLNAFLDAVREGRISDAENILTQSQEERFINSFKVALVAYP